MKASKAIIAGILALLILMGVQILSTVLIYSLTLTGLPMAVVNLIHAFFYLALTYVLIRILIERYLRMDMADIGVGDIRVSPKWFIISFVLPAAVFGFYLLFPGTMHSTNLSSGDFWDLMVEGIVVAGIAAGFIEELIFRGVMMTVFEKAFGKYVAFIVPSFIFAVFYVVWAGLSFPSSMQVIVAGTVVGVMFSFVAYEEGNLWNSALLHTVWNMVMIGGIFVIGGNAAVSAKFTYVLDSKNPLITGGEFGVEASLICILAYVIVAIIAYKGMNKRKSF